MVTHKCKKTQLVRLGKINVFYYNLKKIVHVNLCVKQN